MSTTSLSICTLISTYIIVSLCLCFPHSTSALHGVGKYQEGGNVPVPMPVKHGIVVTKEQRWNVVSTEFGEISAVKVSDGRDGFYHLQFITMEPNSLFVPAHLHSDMVFFVNSGNGTLSWVDLENDKDKGKLQQLELRTGDVYRLRAGSFFYLESNLDSYRRKFRINAIFSDSKDELREGSSFGPYSSVADLLLGFDDKVLQAALNVNEEVIGELRSVGRQQMIVHGVSKATELFEVHYRNMRAFLGFIENGMVDVNKKKKKKKDKDSTAYNILEAKHDVENCNGWSLVVTSKEMKALRDSDFGIFLVNLTKGAMMGPHWNPRTAEIAVVLNGRGMVNVVCPSSVDEAECKNSRFRVEEGDVFVVPRYHPMAQISFNNGSFVFLGFTTTQMNNHPQYLAGSASVFQVLDRKILAASLGVSNMTMDELLSAQNESIILECTSCAEEEERLMEEEIQRQKEEEARQKEEEARKEEEEARKREEEEAKKREEEEAARKEEEEARKREEEEAKKREEEEAARQEEEEEAKKREEEEAARQEEEARKREEEEAARREEEARKEEEAAARKREEEEAAARQQEEEAEMRRQEEEAARRQEEEAARRQQEQEEEAARRQQEQEEAARRQQEEEAARRQQEEEEEAARRQQEQEEAARRQQEEEVMRRKQEQEAARRQQEQEEAARQQQEEVMRRKQEQEASRRQEEARRREEEARRGGGGRGGGERGHRGQGEGEAASQSEEEMAQREKEAEAAAAGGQGGVYPHLILNGIKN